MRLTTPRGEGGIGVIRLEGTGAGELLSRRFRAAGAAGLPRPGHIAYGHVLDSAGEPVDEVIVAHVAGRPSCYEINCHGGPVAVRAVLRILESAGAAPESGAEPLLRRSGTALEEELARLLVDVLTPLAAEIIACQLSGVLEARLRQLIERPEPRALAKLLDSAHAGLRLTNPASVAIVGPPNVGKSTLMNRLLETERVIVYDQPGTTRDVVSELASIDGLPVRLSDTAGVPEALLERIETESEEALQDPDVIAARRAWAEGLAAELLIVLLDATTPPDPAEHFFASQRRRPALFALNKIDRTRRHVAAHEVMVGGPLLHLSAETGEGVALLKEAVVLSLARLLPPPSEPILLTRRQVKAVEEALRAAEDGEAEEASAVLERVISG